MYSETSNVITSAVPIILSAHWQIPPAFKFLIERLASYYKTFILLYAKNMERINTGE